MSVNHTIQSQWIAVRTNTAGVPTLVATNDGAGTLLTNANENTDWKHMPVGRWVNIPIGATGLFLSLIGDHAADPDNLQVTTKLFFYYDKGPAHEVCTITWTIGKRKVLNFPYPPDQDKASATAKWADAGAVASVKWTHTPTEYNTANDEQAIIVIHAAGARRMLMEVTGLGAGLSVMPVFNYHND